MGPGALDDIIVWASVEHRIRLFKQNGRGVSRRCVAHCVAEDLKKEACTADMLSAERIRRIHRKVEKWLNLDPEIKQAATKYLNAFPHCRLIPQRLKTVKNLEAFKKNLGTPRAI
jgi:hypothetical protein